MSTIRTSGPDPLIAVEKQAKVLNDLASRLPQGTGNNRTQKQQRKVYNCRTRANESLGTARKAIRAADNAWSAVFDLDIGNAGDLRCGIASTYAQEASVKAKDLLEESRRTIIAATYEILHIWSIRNKHASRRRLIYDGSLGELVASLESGVDLTTLSAADKTVLNSQSIWQDYR